MSDTEMKGFMISDDEKNKLSDFSTLSTKFNNSTESSKQIHAYKTKWRNLLKMKMKILTIVEPSDIDGPLW